MRAAWWWIDRWRKSTAYTDMTAEEQGVYRNLLDELWLRDGVLPLSDKALAQISGDYRAWDRVRDTVLARFRKTPGGYRNDTHDEVAGQSLRRAEKQRRYRERRRNVTGNAGGNKPGSPSPSPDQTPEPSPKPPKPPKGGEVVGLWNEVKNGQAAARMPKDRIKLKHLSGFWDECDGDEALARASLTLMAARYEGTGNGLWNGIRPANRTQYIDAAREGVGPDAFRRPGRAPRGYDPSAREAR